VWEVSQDKDGAVDIDLDKSMSVEFEKKKDSFQDELEKGKEALQGELEKGKETLKVYQSRLYEEVNERLDWDKLKNSMHLGDFSDLKNYLSDKVKNIKGK